MADKWSKFVDDLLEGSEVDPRERRSLAATSSLLKAAVDQIAVPPSFEEASRQRVLAEMERRYRRRSYTRWWMPFAPALRAVMGFFRWRP
jgi:predicted metalloendopeptidase